MVRNWPHSSKQHPAVLSEDRPICADFSVHLSVEEYFATEYVGFCYAPLPIFYDVRTLKREFLHAFDIVCLYTLAEEPIKSQPN